MEYYNQGDFMYGIILVGHGEFAKGLLSSVDMIMGKQEYLEAISFKVDDSTEELSSKIESKIKDMKNLNGLIFLTDLVGGTPFNTCVLLALELENARVLGGTNLPLLFEILMNRQLENIDDIINTSISTGRDSIISYIDKSKGVGNTIRRKGI